MKADAEDSGLFGWARHHCHSFPETVKNWSAIMWPGPFAQQRQPAIRSHWDAQKHPPPGLKTLQEVRDEVRWPEGVEWHLALMRSPLKYVGGSLRKGWHPAPTAEQKQDPACASGHPSKEWKLFSKQPAWPQNWPQNESFSVDNGRERKKKHKKQAFQVTWQWELQWKLQQGW